MSAGVYRHRAFPLCTATDGCNTIRLDISKAQLASILGTIPETLSRIMARMAQAGLIQLHGQREIEIVDRRLLKDLAQPGGRLG